MNKREFVISEVLPGQLNAMVKNVMSHMGISDPNEAVRRINAGEWVVIQAVRSWREENGVIYLRVTSDGTTGPQWIERLEKVGFRLSKYAKSVLLSSDFKPTKGVTYEIAILKGMLFEDQNRVTSLIRAEADSRKYMTPNAEMACLIRMLLSDKEIEAMGLWGIVAMHNPIEDSGGGPRLLAASRRDEGPWLRAYGGRPDFEWDSGIGFAFVVSQHIGASS